MVNESSRSPRPSTSWGNSSTSPNSNRRGKTPQSSQQNGNQDSSKSISPQKAGALQHVPCKFYKNGACNAGKNCIFSHSMDVTPESAVCKYYLKGNCKFGNKCALLHSKGLNALNDSLKFNGKMGASVNSGRGIQREDFPMLTPERTLYRQKSPPHSLFLREPMSRNIHENQSSHYVGMLGSSFESSYGYGSESPFLSPEGSLFGHQSSSRPPMSISLPNHDPTFMNLLGLSPNMERFDNIYQGRSHGSPFMPLSVGGLPHIESPRRSLDPISEAGLKLDGLENLQIQDDISYGQGILPSSLDELLTPNEIETRRSSFLGSPVSANKPNSFGRFNRSHHEESYFGNSYTSPVMTPPVSRRSQSSCNLEFVSNLWKNDVESDYTNNVSSFEEDKMSNIRSLASPLTIPKGNSPFIARQYETSTPKTNGNFSSSLDEDIQFYMEDETDHFTPGKSDHFGEQSYSRESFQKQPLCPSGITGKCQYEPNCQYIHGIPCPSCCKFVLHPYQTPQQHQAHITECISKNTPRNEKSPQPTDIKCGICHETVLSKPDGHFAIMNCEHPFCINCIQEWQANQSPENKSATRCPLCHEISHFIIPSTTWTIDWVQKQHLFDEYKSKLSSTPCRHFNSLEKQCPFGNSCLYAHEPRPLKDDNVSFYTNSTRKNQTTEEEIRVLGSST